MGKDRGDLAVDVEELVRGAKALRMQSVELLEPDEWKVAIDAGLTCAMGYAPAGDPRTRLTVGWSWRAQWPASRWR